MPTVNLRRESKSSPKSDGKFTGCRRGGVCRTHPALLYLPNPSQSRGEDAVCEDMGPFTWGRDGGAAAHPRHPAL